MLMYNTQIIDSRDKIEKCPIFYINNAQWTCKCTPSAWGHLAYIPGDGLFVKMFCDETDPRRTVTAHGDKVIMDSVLEAFFAFPDERVPLDEEGRPGNDGLYINFEINANGALYAKTGWGRQGRETLTEEELEAASPSAWIDAEGWGVEFTIPDRLITRLIGINGFKPGDEFYCNFYKMSENPEIEHYFTYNLIESEKPNFHLPRCFAKAVVV